MNKIVFFLAALPSLAATNITGNVTLQADADWGDRGTVTIASGATVDLNGHALKVKGLACDGTVVDGKAIPGYWPDFPRNLPSEKILKPKSRIIELTGLVLSIMDFKTL